MSVNLSDRPQHAELDVGPAAGAYAEFFTSTNRNLGNHESLDLEPWGYRVYLSGTPKPAAALHQ